MASGKSRLTIIRSPTAIDELDGVWRWNAERYGVTHADAYLRYLKESIADLANSYARGKTVSTRPDLHYVVIRRKASGHGHVAVYNFDDREVHILHVFHTAQDWQTKLIEEKP
ncbi:MAG: type II toxin-antitoxin system RelE/ParE family toxin [Tepidisphaeraceae bacterium]